MGNDVTGGWSGVLIVEDTESGDGRMFSGGSLMVAPLPLPLMWQRETSAGHDGSVQVGRIDEVWRDGKNIHGRGVFDLGSEHGSEAFRQVREGFLRGISGDVDSVRDADVELVYADAPGMDEDPFAALFAMPSLTIFHGGRLRGATLVQFPAFVEASVKLDDDMTAFVASANAPTAPLSFTVAVDLEEALTACGCTDIAPPAEWFQRPADLMPDGSINITNDGRIYGYGAVWGTCHTGFANQCVTPPREGSHDYFMLGETMCMDGSRVSTGTITMGTGHAATQGLSPTAATAHYDNTGTVVADIVTGEDQFGIWYSGALRPGLSPMRLQALRAAKLSGDWRRIGDKLRLVAFLAVNVPGFPVPRTRAHSNQGRQMSLVAAGLVTDVETNTVVDDSESRARLDAITASLRERVHGTRAEKLSALRARVHGR